VLRAPSPSSPKPGTANCNRPNFNSKEGGGPFSTPRSPLRTKIGLTGSACRT
jgi:hypothetical protein